MVMLPLFLPLTAPMVLKVLDSAIANAENRSNDIDVDQLIVSEAYVNEGPRMKRIRPAPMGRAYRYQRRLTHIILSVAERNGGHGLVTKVDEPKAEAKGTKTGSVKAGSKTGAAKKAAPKKTAAKKSAAAPKKKAVKA